MATPLKLKIERHIFIKDNHTPRKEFRVDFLGDSRYNLGVLSEEEFEVLKEGLTNYVEPKNPIIN